MAHLRIARRYTKALFDLSVEQASLQEVYQSLQSVDQAVKNSLELREFLSNPVISKSQQKNVVEALFKDRAHPTVLQFLFFLIDKKRLNLLGDVFECFDALYLEYKATVSAKVTTAMEIEDAQLNRLVKKLETNTQKKILVQPIIEPAILGGYKVQMGDRVFDNSFATQLERFHRNLINQG